MTAAADDHCARQATDRGYHVLPVRSTQTAATAGLYHVLVSQPHMRVVTESPSVHAVTSAAASLTCQGIASQFWWSSPLLGTRLGCCRQTLPGQTG